MTQKNWPDYFVQKYSDVVCTADGLAIVSAALLPLTCTRLPSLTRLGHGTCHVSSPTLNISSPLYPYFNNDKPACHQC